jgi:hypothetical protein
VTGEAVALDVTTDAGLETLTSSAAVSSDEKLVRIVIAVAQCALR